MQAGRSRECTELQLIPLGTNRVPARFTWKSAIFLIAALALSTGADARIKRSSVERHAFVRANACPATGAHRLPCPGYVVDHVIALACGGPDNQSNMQWQTIAEGKAKDRWERIGCQRKTIE